MKQSASKRPLAILLGSLVVGGCAGDGTGLDQNGEPLTLTMGVELAVQEVALPVGAMFVLGVTTTDAQGNVVSNRPVTWSSTNPGVASVDAAGVITALSAGSASISASSDGATAVADVVVVTSARLSTDVQPIFSANCAFNGCHGGPTPRLGQDLTDGNTFAHVVNVPSSQVPTMNRVTPDDPAQSYLIYKIRGTFAEVGGSGGRMPLGSGPLSENEIDIVRAWVQTGALNN